MYRNGDTVEVQVVEGTRTFRKVLRVVQGNNSGGVGVDVFHKGMLIPFNDNEVTSFVMGKRKR